MLEKLEVHSLYAHGSMRGHFVTRARHMHSFYGCEAMLTVWRYADTDPSLVSFTVYLGWTTNGSDPFAVGIVRLIGDDCILHWCNGNTERKVGDVRIGLPTYLEWIFTNFKQIRVDIEIERMLGKYDREG